MKMTKLTVEYKCTRSSQYQSVSMGAAVEIDIEAGEDKKACFETARTWLAEQVNQSAAEELDRVLYGGA